MSSQLMLLFEDLHWIDAETKRYSIPSSRACRRPGCCFSSTTAEYQHQWGSKTYTGWLRIDPLPAERAEDLLSPELARDRRLSGRAPAHSH
jgi:hypothetical protein